MTRYPLREAKRIASQGLSFQIPANAGCFPPRDVPNAFFACGYDDLPNRGILDWKPFRLSESEYQALLAWWQLSHPEARAARLRLRGSDFSRWFSHAIECGKRTQRYTGRPARTG
jgi:hypothetical protein